MASKQLTSQTSHSLDPPPISTLPVELILEITDNLDNVDLKKLVHVSRYLRLIGGPMVYKDQKAITMDQLARLKLLSEQADVAPMIRNLELDQVSMNYWWPAVSGLLEDILPRLPNLESLSLRLSHSIPASLSLSLSSLKHLHTLRLQLQDTRLGDTTGAMSGLRDVNIDWTTSGRGKHINPAESVTDLANLLTKSTTTLEHLTINTHDPSWTSSLISSLASESGSLRRVIGACSRLSCSEVHLDVRDARQAIHSVEVIAQRLPVTTLTLRRKPAVFPAPPSEGYGLGIEVLRSVSNSLPRLQHLYFDDGEVGKRNLVRPADGSIFEEFVTCLRQLKYLRSVDLPILMDDLVVHVPKVKENVIREIRNSVPLSSDSTAKASPEDPAVPSPAVADQLMNPQRIEFEQNANDIVNRTLQGLFFDSNGRSLKYLKDLRLRIYPTINFARQLRSVGIYLPSMTWARQVIRDEQGRPRGWKVVQPTS